MEWIQLLLVLPILGLSNGEYYGKLLGSFSEDAHELKGMVYAVDENRIIIKDFNYDGLGPDAFFWVGKRDTTQSDTPNGEGTIIPDESGSTNILGAYSSKTILLNLGSITLRDIRWISVWCRRFSANFGWLRITEAMTSSLPGPRVISSFVPRAHGLRSGEVTLIDAHTIRIKDFHYDGFGPDAYFLIGKGEKPTASGEKIPDENGSTGIVKGYNGKEITLKLPAAKTFFDIDYLSLYCIRFTENFGEVRFDNLPAGSLIPNVEQYKSTNNANNCETLIEGVFNVAWEIDGGNAIIELTAAVAENDYLAFGISGNPSASAMIGGDVTVVWKKNGVARAEDYYMSSYSLCSGNTGVCPDSSNGGTKDVELLEYNTVNGVTKAKYRRTLAPSDNTLDKVIQPNSLSQIIWAIGGINEQNQVTKHHTRITASKQIQFGRTGSNNCRPVTPAKGNTPQTTPWTKQTLFAADGDVLIASLGPTGGEKGYKAITGKQSWGIAWYINGLLIPEITVRRGSNITFWIQGGNNPTVSAKYHPFYLTDDPVGGYADKSAAERQNVKIYPVMSGGRMVNLVTGKYCEYVPKSAIDVNTINSFDEFKLRLNLQCENGNPGQFVWHVDESTPNTVYYQCYTHNYLGWKINVVDDAVKGAASYLSLNFALQALSSLFLVH